MMLLPKFKKGLQAVENLKTYKVTIPLTVTIHSTTPVAALTSVLELWVNNEIDEYSDTSLLDVLRELRVEELHD
jgi:hypothetical protein